MPHADAPAPEDAFPSTYFMAITPKDGKDRPQMPIIEKYTSTFKK